MGVLISGLEAAMGGRGRLFLVSGEPGIGKSRLADEFGAEARSRDARVLWGRCWEAGGAPAYWPWVQSFRSYLREAPPEAIRKDIGSKGPDLARMLPELRGFLGDVPEPAAVDAETARFRLFDAAAGFLIRASRRHALVMILDDLHAADIPSLLFLRFLGNALTDARMVVMGAYRDTGLAPDHPLSAAVADLDRLPVTLRIPLSGITRSDVASLIRTTTGERPSEDVASAVHARTEGNPLFVWEMVRLLGAEGRLQGSTGPDSAGFTIPAGLRDVILRRFEPLPREAVSVLTLAAVLGREFSLVELERVSGLAPDRLVDLLEDAATLRLVEDVPGILGRMRFSHALVRDALYEELPRPRRATLHGETGAALENLYARGPGEHLTELAHHFVLAAPGGDIDRAVGYARRAGQRSLDLLAYEEAARLFSLALQALDLRKPVDDPMRCELLLKLGDALARAGDEERAKATFLDAARLATTLGDGHLMARAALGYGGRFVWARAGTDQQVVLLLQQALRALPQRDSPLRARVMARLAGALRDDPRPEPRVSLSAEALEMARRLQDPSTLAYALDGRYAVLLWPENARERIGVADELQTVAEEHGDLEKAVQARCYRTIALLELGDLAAVRTELAGAQVLAEQLGQRPQLWLVAAMQATVAIFEGRFEEAETLVERALALGEGGQRRDAILSHRVHSFSIRRFRGGLEALQETMVRSVDEYPARPMFRCMLALLYAETGRERGARAILEQLAASGFAAIPRSNEWLFSLSMLAEVTGLLGDGRIAESLYELLLPHATLNGATADYIATGSVSRYLGILASVLGRWKDADRWFAEALESHGTMGAQPHAALTLYDEARGLLARDERGDRDRAGQRLTEAAEICAELGMGPLERKVRLLLQGIAAPEPAVGHVVSRSSIFRRDGDSWRIAFEGDAFHLRDLKGLRYLARLLAEPGREFHALDLVISEGGGSGPRPPRPAPELQGSGTADAGALLDPRAKSEYRRRLLDLETEIDEAHGLGDPERAARLEEERQFLIRELRRAIGLSGRDRRAASPSERARVSVTQAIRAALARIREQSLSLAEHLDRTIHTGTFCSYQPDPRAPADWRT